jgi:hypothetical protein
MTQGSTFGIYEMPCSTSSMNRHGTNKHLFVKHAMVGVWDLSLSESPVCSISYKTQVELFSDLLKDYARYGDGLTLVRHRECESCPVNSRIAIAKGSSFSHPPNHPASKV